MLISVGYQYESGSASFSEPERLKFKDVEAQKIRDDVTVHVKNNYKYIQIKIFLS